MYVSSAIGFGKLDAVLITELYYYYYYRSAMKGWERAIHTLSLQRPQPHNTNLYKERRERESSRRQKRERVDKDNNKALAFLLKPACPTQSNTGSVR